MDSKDLALLEFTAVRDIIASYCSFALSRDIALMLTPSDDISVIHASLSASAQAGILLSADPSIYTSDLENIAPDVHAAALGKILDAKTLAQVRTSLEVLQFLRTRIIPHHEKVPLIAAKASHIGNFANAINAISRAISPNGEILPNASPMLKAIRQCVQNTRGALVDRLQSFIAADTEKRYIQEPIITEREGRYVVAVKKERRGDVSGIVHDISNTGATVFVEPWQTLEMGNALKELQLEEVHEIERILAEISEAIGGMSSEIDISLNAAASIDFEIAKARYAKRTGAIEATVYAPSHEHPPVIRLTDARHPLLGADAIPFSLELGRDFSILMITGPNTGGKTVALKTIGLLCLMTQAGLPIPAGAGTRLPVLSGIFADIGDEQSIHATMSTFGWHMSNISRILREAKGACLVLLDELGASTDPQEGSALGRAIIQYLLNRRILGVVTTHYTELKLFAHTTQGLQNASFEFDPYTLRPTYHLVLGTPGGSNAIATAASFNLPPEIISCARDSLSSDAHEMESLLARLQAERTQLSELIQTTALEKERFISRSTELENEIRKLNSEKQQLIQDTRDDLVIEMSSLQKEIKLAASALKHDRSEETVNKARQTMQSTGEKLNKKFSSIGTTAFPCKDDSFAIGDHVWLIEFGVEASIVAINEHTGQIEAASGNLLFHVNKDSISRTSTPTTNYSTQHKNPIPSKDTRPELDLRGRRAEEVVSLFDNYISDAALSGRRSVRIIHGFGTGTVRSIVREQAARHPLVKSFHSAEPNEGGDGATIVELK